MTAQVAHFTPKRTSANVLLTSAQIMVLAEALRMARVEVEKAITHLRFVQPDSIAYAEQLARYAEQMGETLDYLMTVNV